MPGDFLVVNIFVQIFASKCIPYIIISSCEMVYLILMFYVVFLCVPMNVFFCCYSTCFHHVPV